jgi:hypothetical protein
LDAAVSALKPKFTGLIINTVFVICSCIILYF